MNKPQDIFDNVISLYPQAEAIDDGVLLFTGYVGKLPVVFTSNLFYEGFEDKEDRIRLIERGLKLLSQPDLEDTAYMRLRVIEAGKIWVVLDGNGLTFMKPADY